MLDPPLLLFYGREINLAVRPTKLLHLLDGWMSLQLSFGALFQFAMNS